MSNALNISNRRDDFVAVEHLDYTEDKLIELCEDMQREGVHLLEITSALIFATHYLLSSEQKEVAEKYYRFLSKQCTEQMDALHEFYDLPITRKKQP